MGLLKEAGLLADRDLGQHFLVDPSICRRAALAGGSVEGARVLEIGPGPAGLSRALLEEGVLSLTAVELDRRFSPILELVLQAFPNRFQIHYADALTFDLRGAEPHGQVRNLRVVANLPYQIATRLIVSWLGREDPPHSVTVMVQKEVADRILAPPGSRAYGRLSVYCQLLASGKLCFRLGAGAFFPPPKVGSAMVHLRPTGGISVAEREAVREVTRAAFSSRRKMLRNTLAPLFQEGEGALEAIGLNPKARAEVVAPKSYLALAHQLQDERGLMRTN